MKRLPTGVTPFVFPPITVKPEEFVSDPLIDAVINCEGLIYLRRSTQRSLNAGRATSAR
jgi:hypothetical protein